MVRRRFGDPFVYSTGVPWYSSTMLWSRPFLIDFDELSLPFAGSDPHGTVVQLFVDGILVYEVGGGAEEVPRAQIVRLPVTGWRNRIGQLHVVRSLGADHLALTGAVQSRRYVRPLVLDGFEQGSYGDLWTTRFEQAPVPVRALARRYGLAFGQGEFVASSIGSEGRQVLTSAPFTVDRKWLSLTAFDLGKGTEIRLIVDGRPVHRWQGKDSGLPEPITWYLGPWQGKQAMLQIVDGNPDAEQGIAVDTIVLFDEE